jgi:5-bromo-4-chloroindolyl phosphate hydrolysis protein
VTTEFSDWVRDWRRRAQDWSPRGLLLYGLALPLFPAFAISLVRADLRMLAVEAGALFLLLYGAALARGGLRQELAYRRRRVARAPKLPKKALGACLVAAGVFVCAFLGWSQSLPVSLGLAAASLAGFFLSYGFDPRRAKSVATGPYGFTPEEVLGALEEANAAIERIEAALRRIRQPELSRRLRRIAELARGIVGLIEEDPRSLRRARKFLRVYLSGARQVAEGYARTHRLRQSAELEASFRNVLVTIEDVFQEQRERLLDVDAVDLDVQIEVLAAQLEREGVR